ncbi:MAG TPA: hypothetical protein VN621_05745 [Arthrobacter sp.]|nr:hypothetical protein [Arthrobacter sp.]
MTVVLSAVRLFFVVVVVCALVALGMVAFGSAGVQLHHDNLNRWSGLIGLLLVGSAAPAALGLVSPKWILGTPLALGLAVVPLVALVIVQWSDVMSRTAQVWALIGAVGALLAVLSLPAVGFGMRHQRRRA